MSFNRCLWVLVISLTFFKVLPNLTNYHGCLLLLHYLTLGPATSILIIIILLRLASSFLVILGASIMTSIIIAILMYLFNLTASLSLNIARCNKALSKKFTNILLQGHKRFLTYTELYKLSYVVGRLCEQRRFGLTMYKFNTIKTIVLSKVVIQIIRLCIMSYKLSQTKQSI